MKDYLPIGTLDSRDLKVSEPFNVIGTGVCLEITRPNQNEEDLRDFDCVVVPKTQIFKLCRELLKFYFKH
jgi:hypothetical protein